jgi:hypothetical protein
MERAVNKLQQAVDTLQTASETPEFEDIHGALITVLATLAELMPPVPPTEPSLREAIAQVVNDHHQMTRSWEEMISRTGMARTVGDDYALLSARRAADALHEHFTIALRGAPAPAVA